MAKGSLGVVIVLGMGLEIAACDERTLEFGPALGSVGGASTTEQGGATNTALGSGGLMGFGGSVEVGGSVGGTTAQAQPSLLCLGVKTHPRVLVPVAFNLAPIAGTECAYSVPETFWPSAVAPPTNDPFSDFNLLVVSRVNGTAHPIYPQSAGAVDCDEYGGFYYTYEPSAPSVPIIVLCPCSCDAAEFYGVPLGAVIPPLSAMACNALDVDVAAWSVSDCNETIIEPEPVPTADCEYVLPADATVTPTSVLIQTEAGVVQKPPQLASAAECEQSSTGGWFYSHDNPQNIQLCACSCAAAASPSVLSVVKGCDVPVVGQSPTPVE